jgi:hypothetical protein
VITMSLPTALTSVVAFLRAGYPDGVPEQDYQPLLALLRRQLTVEEVREVADGLAATGDAASADAIRAAISDLTHAEPREEDVARVRAHLAAGGWPLATLSQRA